MTEVTAAEWEVALHGLRAFLADGHGDEAQRLGWPRDELYAVPPVWPNVSQTGAALLISDCEVVGITPTEIRIKAASGSTLAFYRKPEVDYAVAYRARLRQIGDEALKEENRLRAFEAVVNLFRANHPDADIDDSQRSCAGRHRQGEREGLKQRPGQRRKRGPGLQGSKSE